MAPRNFQLFPNFTGEVRCFIRWGNAPLWALRQQAQIVVIFKPPPLKKADTVPWRSDESLCIQYIHNIYIYAECNYYDYESPYVIYVYIYNVTLTMIPI